MTFLNGPVAYEIFIANIRCGGGIQNVCTQFFGAQRVVVIIRIIMIIVAVAAFFIGIIVIILPSRFTSTMTLAKKASNAIPCSP